MTTNEFISQYKVVPVVVFNTLDEVRPKLSAMVKGGLPIAEITYRTACAGDAIRIAIEINIRFILYNFSYYNDKYNYSEKQLQKKGQHKLTLIYLAGLL